MLPVSDRYEARYNTLTFPINTHSSTAIIQHIADMDADIITIECSRSQMELLDAFAAFKYPNEIGPGVHDIHSPRIPSKKKRWTCWKKHRR